MTGTQSRHTGHTIERVTFFPALDSTPRTLTCECGFTLSVPPDLALPDPDEPLRVAYDKHWSQANGRKPRKRIDSDHGTAGAFEFGRRPVVTGKDVAA